MLHAVLKKTIKTKEKIAINVKRTKGASHKVNKKVNFESKIFQKIFFLVYQKLFKNKYKSFSEAKQAQGNHFL
jgi:hypothetical protein